MYDLTALQVYLHEINQQIDEYAVELNQLAQLENLSNRDYYAAERLLQVMIEACIGISKHWLKFLGKTVPNDAYRAFTLLVDYNLLAEHELIMWRKIIGLRNALVHDYLNLDREIIKTILKEQHYLKLVAFIEQATLAMKISE